MGHYLFGPTVIETASGRALDYADPRQEAISVHDIAHGLSNVCRFACQPLRFYSVAEHSVLVHDLLEAEGASQDLLRAGLFHDAHEAYVGDLARPLKPLLGEEFRVLVSRLDTLIAWEVGTNVELFEHSRVKRADNQALFLEGQRLMPSACAGWNASDLERQSLPMTVAWRCGLDPDEAKASFLERVEKCGL